MWNVTIMLYFPCRVLGGDTRGSQDLRLSGAHWSISQMDEFQWEILFSKMKLEAIKGRLHIGLWSLHSSAHLCICTHIHQEGKKEKKKKRHYDTEEADSGGSLVQGKLRLRSDILSQKLKTKQNRRIKR